MPNFTFQIENCKIFEFKGKPDRSKCWGILTGTCGTKDFEQKFETYFQDVMDFIEANRSAEVEFKVSGHVDSVEGYGNYKGKFYNNFIVDKVEIAGMEKMDVQELVKKVFDIPESEENDDTIPF